MNRMARSVLYLGFALVGAATHADELTPQKRSDVRALLLENGIVRITKDSFVNSMKRVDIFRGCAGCPSNAKEILTEVAATVVEEKATQSGQLIDQLIPIYSELFSHQEILSWLEFVRSPIGKKVVENNIAMAPALSETTNAWIKTLQPTINERTDAAFEKAKKTGEKVK